MTIREHKSEAIESVGMHLGRVVVIMLIYSLIAMAAKWFSIADIPIGELLLTPALEISICSIALTLQQGLKPEVSQLKDGFEMYLKSLWLYLSCNLISAFWGMLFIVPGIIRYYSYSMASFIMAEHPGFSVKDARQLSRELTNEYKLRIFLFDLSFIGWYIVAIVALALLNAGMLILPLVISVILTLGLTPYYMTAKADLYQYIKEEKNMVELSKEYTID